MSIGRYILKSSKYVKRITSLLTALIIYKISLLSKKLSLTKTEGDSLSPIWVLGIYRSGTSLVSEILTKIGIDFGPKYHLFRGVGRLGNLNPRGFFENYLFADIARYIYIQLNATGFAPPSKEQAANYLWEDIDDKLLYKYSLVQIKDDRISKWNKFKILSRYNSSNINQYLSTCFSSPFAIKVPQLTCLTPILLNKWVNSSFIIVFRNPESVLKSSFQLSKEFNYDSYISHYEPLLELDRSKCIFICYDTLMEKPKYSVEMISKAIYGNKRIQLENAVAIIDSKLNRNKVEFKIDMLPERLIVIYQQMQKLACNIE